MSKQRWTDLKIGDRVEVTHDLVCSYRPDLSVAQSTYKSVECHPYVAWVSGLGVVYEGKTTFGDYGSNNDFQWTKTIPVVKVRRGLTNKEINVPLDGVKKLDPGTEIPWLHQRIGIIPEWVRQELRNEAKRAPRDSKGRFIKVVAGVIK
jgi:hypothetical protein